MNNLSFRISTGLKNIIGRDLISDKFIAVFELVKNSYDAGAHSVVITFLRFPPFQLRDLRFHLHD